MSELVIPHGLAPPPQSSRNHDEAAYFPSALADIGRIVDAVGIAPSHQVLDIGCAAGRLAFPLVRLLDPAEGGGYLGIDVKPGAIEWARENITAHYPHIQFQHIDARNSVVNPAGSIEQSQVHLPAEDGTLNLVLLSSVFTHMLEPGIRRYTSEIARCLKPGGALYMTAFLFDAETWMACPKRSPAWNFKHRVGALAVHDPERPEFAVALFDDFILPLADAHGLAMHAVYKDAWNIGGGQDVLFFKKRGVLQS